MGVLWSFFNPLLMLSVYTFVFGVVFQARWGDGASSKTEYAVVIFAGLIIFNMFSECVSRAPNLIVSNANYVKKIIYPLEILPVVIVTSAMFHFLVSFGVWLIAYFVFFGVPHATILFFPLIVFPFAVFIVGICWALASLGVFLRDVAQVISVLIAVLMFFSPIFYPISAVNGDYQYFLYFNPLTTVIEVARDALIWGRFPDVMELCMYWVISVTISWLGFAWFQKTRNGFADVL
jgi:lipopolysaccharide transport system permease protein